MFSRLEGHPREHSITSDLINWKGTPKGTALHFFPLKGYFITFSPLEVTFFFSLEKHPRGHYIVFSTLEGYPNGYH